MAHVKGLILGSTSPFRKHLLDSLGIPFEAMAPLADEREKEGGPPNQMAAARAQLKAESLAAQHPSSLIIGGDQVLALEGRSFDKANTPVEALERLQFLRGKEHTLHSALCLVYSDENGQPKVVGHDEFVARLMMRNLTDEELQAYVATGEWQGSVGCYKLEAKGIGLFDHVEGDSSTIIGLPLILLTRMFFDIGLNYLTQPNPPWDLNLNSNDA